MDSSACCRVGFMLSLALGVSSVASAGADELAALIAPGAQVERVVDRMVFSEGPAWSPAGFLLFSEVPSQRILRVTDEGTGATESLIDPSGGANGLAFDARGRLYACQGGQRRVVRFDDLAARTPRVLADSFDGKKLNSPNDLALDPQGGVYFTDSRYRRGEPLEQPVMGVYYVGADGDGGVRRVVDDLERPNGIRVSGDGRQLYVADSRRGEIWRYDIVAPGRLGDRTLFFKGDAKIDGGGPDGITLDGRGNLYAAYRSIVVLTAVGRVLGRLPLGERPTNCTFGGNEWKTLYITVRSGLYRLAMQVEGQRPFPMPAVASAGLDQPGPDALDPTRQSGARFATGSAP